MSESKGIRGDMTAGSPMRLILAFSIPLLLGNVLQQMYNMVDSIVATMWGQLHWRRLEQVFQSSI